MEKYNDGVSVIDTKIKNRRVTHCFNCKKTLDNYIDEECDYCNWIRCNCGACGCDFWF